MKRGEKKRRGNRFGILILSFSQSCCFCLSPSCFPTVLLCLVFFLIFSHFHTYLCLSHVLLLFGLSCLSFPLVSLLFVLPIALRISFTASPFFRLSSLFCSGVWADLLFSVAYNHPCPFCSCVPLSIHSILHIVHFTSSISPGVFTLQWSLIHNQDG